MLKYFPGIRSQQACNHQLEDVGILDHGMATGVGVRAAVLLSRMEFQCLISPGHKLVTAEECVAARVRGACDLAQSAARIGCQSSEDGPHSGGQLGCAPSGQSSRRGPWDQTGQTTLASHSENTLSLLAVGVDGEQGVLQS